MVVGDFDRSLTINSTVNVPMKEMALTLFPWVCVGVCVSVCVVQEKFSLYVKIGPPTASHIELLLTIYDTGSAPRHDVCGCFSRWEGQRSICGVLNML